MRKLPLIVLIFLAFFFFPITALAQEEATPSAVSSEISYTLPYPGILPDNPLYFFKVVRDRIVFFLISDPLKKAHFNLLQADKRLAAGIYLFNEKPEKSELIVSTISKGENYFELAILELQQAKKEGRDIKPLLDEMKKAAPKHEEEIRNLAERMDESFAQQMEEIAGRTQMFSNRVNLLSPQEK